MTTTAAPSRGAPPAAPPPLFTLRAHTEEVQALSFSSNRPDGLFSGDGSGRVLLWDLGVRRPVMDAQAHTKGILWLHSSPGGLWTQGRDGCIRLWDTAEGRLSTPIRTFPCAAGTFCAAAVGSVGPGVTNACPTSATGVEGTADVGEAAAGAGAGAGAGASASAGANVVRATAAPPPPDATAATTPPEAPPCPAPPTALPATLLAAPHPSGSEVLLFDVRAARHVRTVAFSASRIGLCMGIGLVEPARMVLAAFEDGGVYGHDLATGRPVVHLPVDKQPFTSMQWQSQGDGGSGVVAGASKQVCAFSVNAATADARVLYRVTLPHAGVGCVRVRHDHKLLATCGWDGCLRLFAAKSGKALAVLPAHTGSCHTAAFCAADTTATVGAAGLLASGGKDGNVVVWSVYPPKPTRAT